MEPVYTALEYSVAQTNAGVIGFIFGIIVAIGIYYIIVQGYRINIAKYIRRLSGDKKKIVLDDIIHITELVKELAEDTDAKYFNSIYNDLTKLYAFVQKKWNT